MGASTSKAGPPGGCLPKQAGGVMPPPGLGGIPLAEQAAAPCTVYVGRISAEVSDDFVRHLLEKCGKISKWNRAADPNTSKLTSFGFCDFEEPQGVWRALEFLHEQQLCDKRLLVKCEEKAKQTIEAWKTVRRQETEKKRKESPPSEKKEEGEKKDGEKDKEEEVKKPEGPLTDEELHEALRKGSSAAAEDIARILKEKNKGYHEIKPVGEAGEQAKKDDKGDADKENQ